MNNSEEDKEVLGGKMEELHSTQTEEFPTAALAELAASAIIHPLTPFLPDLHLSFLKNFPGIAIRFAASGQMEQKS